MNHKTKGEQLREQAKQIVLEYLQSQPEGKPFGAGIKQAVIFREIGLDWGPFPKATPTNQQYWIVALLNTLQDEGKVEQVRERGPWRLK